MSVFNRLGLLGMLLDEHTRNKISWENNPELMGYLEQQGIEQVTPEFLLRELHLCVATIEREFDYYEASEMKTNEVLSDYLETYAGVIKHNNSASSKDLAMIICSLGNKGGAYEETDGVEALMDIAKYIIGEYTSLGDGEIPNWESAIYIAHGRKLEWLSTVLSLLDVFLTSRLGMVMGVEEFAPLDYNYLNPVDPPDLVGGLECSSKDDCGCGCAFDHPLRILQGMEDFLEGVESEDSEYFQSVARTNNIRLEGYAGNEGPVYEAIKELGNKAYEAIMAAWESVRKWFTDSSENNEADKALKDKVEANKKAIQSMPDKGVQINDAAKNGLKNLAARTDPSGAMGKIVDDLKSPGDASRVLDALLGQAGKQKGVGGPLIEAKKAAEQALADLKKQAASVTGNDDNKEAAKESKALMQEKIKAARESVRSAKKLVQGHSKISEGIKKAINGITPHIFVTSAQLNQEGGEKKPEGNQGGNKNKGKKK